jgi:guanylate cyclase
MASLQTDGLSITAIVVSVQLGDAGRLFYDLGLMVVFFFAYTLSGLPFLWATATSLLTLAVYEVGVLTLQHPLDDPHDLVVFLNVNGFLVWANVAGMFASYFMELYARKDYLQRRTIEAERAKADDLLLNILPREIAATLKENAREIAEEFPTATILFADIVGFTPLAAAARPHEVVAMLNEVFSRFDDLAERYGLEKIKTIGDCYMAAAGVPSPHQDHAFAAASMALAMRSLMRESTFAGGRKLQLRIGLNSGPVIAGVIGRKKFLYDLWGDTVNTASRMESHGSPGEVQITRATYELLRRDFRCEPRGVVRVKGKGTMEVWHVLDAIA